MSIASRSCFLNTHKRPDRHSSQAGNRSGRRSEALKSHLTSILLSAPTPPVEERETPLARAPQREMHGKQAVRSLGPLRCVCYQTSTRGLSTRSSFWDLDLCEQRWEKSSWGRLRA